MPGTFGWRLVRQITRLFSPARSTWVAFRVDGESVEGQVWSDGEIGLGRESGQTADGLVQRREDLIPLLRSLGFTTPAIDQSLNDVWAHVKVAWRSLESAAAR